MLLGYRKALSHEIVDIEEDPIAVPAIEGAIETGARTGGCPLLDAGCLPAGRQRHGFGARHRSFPGPASCLPPGARRPRNSPSPNRLARLSLGGGDRRGTAESPQILIERHLGQYAARRFLAGCRGGGTGDGRSGDGASEEGEKRSRICLPGSAPSRSGWHATRMVHAVEGEAEALGALDRAFRHAAGPEDDYQ